MFAVIHSGRLRGPAVDLRKARSIRALSPACEIYLRRVASIKIPCVVRKGLSREQALNLCKFLNCIGFACYLHDFALEPRRLFTGPFGIECFCRRSALNRRKRDRRGSQRAPGALDKRMFERRCADTLPKLCRK